jgi:hypothetical protein
MDATCSFRTVTYLPNVMTGHQRAVTFSILDKTLVVAYRKIVNCTGVMEAVKMYSVSSERKWGTKSSGRRNPLPLEVTREVTRKMRKWIWNGNSIGAVMVASIVTVSQPIQQCFKQFVRTRTICLHVLNLRTTKNWRYVDTIPCF